MTRAASFKPEGEKPTVLTFNEVAAQDRLERTNHHD